MRVVGPSISAPTRFSAMGRYGSKSCMNPSVSRICRDSRLSRSIISVVGLIQGGELVTARARAMVRGMFQHHTHRSTAQPQLERWKRTRFDNPRDLEMFSRKFDEEVKKVLPASNSRANQYVQFSSSKDNYPDCGISRGKLTFTG